MSGNTATLHMLCGQIASGKSTLAAELARADGTLLVSEDVWLSALFADQMTTGADYVRCAARLRDAMGPHVASILRADVSVVLDFPANTVETRAWMRDIFESAGAVHRLHLLSVPDEECLDRLRTRNARGDHPFSPTEAQFRQFTRQFALPSPGEGFTIVSHDGTG